MQAELGMFDTVQVPLKCAVCRCAYASLMPVSNIADMTGCPGVRVHWCPKFNVMPDAEDALLRGSFRVVKENLARRNIL